MHRHKMPSAWAAVLGAIFLLIGCNRLELEKSISMESVYPNPNQTNVTVYYTVPDPPPGKVYVLWIVNPEQRQFVATGQVPGGRNQSAKATVRFEATGAIIAIENTATPTKMSTTWALKVGTVTLETPTPGGPPTAPNGTSTSVTTPSGQTTPSAGTTPSAATPPVSTPAAATTPAASTPAVSTPGAVTPNASAPTATP